MALAGFAALVIWFVLALRGALLYLEVLAVPLALCGLYWGGTAHWIKRLVDLIIATIVSQLVITMLMVLAAADLNNGHLSVSSSAGTDMTTLFLAVSFLLLGSLALPMALKHVPAATEHAAAATSQIGGPGRVAYMGSRMAGTARVMGRSGGGQQAVVRQAGAAAGPVGVGASVGVGAATAAARTGARGASGAASSAGGAGAIGRGNNAGRIGSEPTGPELGRDASPGRAANPTSPPRGTAGESAVERGASGGSRD